MQPNRLYHAWIQMRRRCNIEITDGRNDRWAHRGIRVCEEWENSFETFEKWSLANGYLPGLSLDRYPDNDGNYEPSNCEWTTRSINSKRARALYDFVPVGKAVRRVVFYDEPTFGDF